MKLTKASQELLERITAASTAGDGSDGVWAYWLTGSKGRFTKQVRGNIADLVKKGLLTAEDFHGQNFYTITPEGIKQMNQLEVK